MQPRAILGQEEVRLHRVARMSKGEFQKDLVILLTHLDQVISTDIVLDLKLYCLCMCIGKLHAFLFAGGIVAERDC